MRPLVPVPSAAKPVPFQRAMLLAAVLPALLKVPPRYSSVPPLTFKANTGPLVPVALLVSVKVCQPPYHFATLLAVWPSAVVNEPAANRPNIGLAVLVMSAVRAKTLPLTPPFKAVHCVPSQQAIRFAAVVPAWVKSPPA